MIKVSDYLRVTVDTNTQFEQDIIKAMVKAYNVGKAHKRSMLNVLDYDDCEWIELECDNEGKNALTTIVSALSKLMYSHDSFVAEQAVLKYKKEHNIKE